MNWIDVIVIGVILLSALFAFARGFVKEVLSIAAWVGAGCAALYAVPLAAPFAKQLIGHDIAGMSVDFLAQAAVAFAVFVVALIVFSFLTSAIARLVKGSMLSSIDRTLGLIFGLLRGVVLVCIAYIALTWASTDPTRLPPWIAEAKTLPFIANGASHLRALIPAAYRDKAEAGAEDAREAARRAQEAAGAMRALKTPKSPNNTTTERKPNYRPEDQRDLNRLITQQQDSP